MTCTTSAAACGGATRTLNSIYDRESTYYGYLYHDFTQELRIGLETNFTRTSYADESYAENRRVMAVFILSILADYGDCTCHQHQAVSMNQVSALSSRTRSELAILGGIFDLSETTIN